MTPAPIEVAFLSDGDQPAQPTADRIAGFIAEARTTLEIAIYDLLLVDGPADTMCAAVQGAVARGVAVRIVFNQEPRPEERLQPLPPPGFADPTLLERMGAPFKPVPGKPDLMHHKYIVRDSQSVLTGSTNWTTDSWTREENVIVTVASPEIALAYRQDFEELWQTTSVAASGHFSVPWADVAGSRVRAFFSPGRGQKMSHEIAHRIASATRRVRIASPVLSSGPILGTLAELIKTPRSDLAGVYDRTQMDEVLYQWSKQSLSSWKAEAFKAVAASGLFASKVSTPFVRPKPGQPGSVHDFMHAKMTVCDDTVFIGSFNLSHSGEANAENVLEIVNPQLADVCASYIDQVRSRYGTAVPA